eukprot:CAMPEP_0174753350 /NCGR_PEP_ID=MMETSP1094-20130205/103899_1 /TAXON_ID=156173 /ORGANISM="Chrysochromulina brevifilum, Strain UTEX LB 985" /LENGTH=37 /DNA_ID= /DNA_START= /DNA_END= /DNA_ORIENTATION=
MTAPIAIEASATNEARVVCTPNHPAVRRMRGKSFRKV